MSTMTVVPSGYVPSGYVPGRRAPRPTSRSRNGSTLRLTRRGRVVVFLAGLATVFALGVTVSAGAGATLHGGSEQVHTVVVAPGDTLWDIAAQAAQGGDIRSMEHHIMELNGLSAGALQVGMHLRVPNN